VYAWRVKRPYRVDDIEAIYPRARYSSITHIVVDEFSVCDPNFDVFKSLDRPSELPALNHVEIWCSRSCYYSVEERETMLLNGSMAHGLKFDIIDISQSALVTRGNIEVGLSHRYLEFRVSDCKHVIKISMFLKRNESTGRSSTRVSGQRS
jgi:hypothetical protein